MAAPWGTPADQRRWLGPAYCAEAAKRMGKEAFEELLVRVSEYRPVGCRRENGKLMLVLRRRPEEKTRA